MKKLLTIKQLVKREKVINMYKLDVDINIECLACIQREGSSLRLTLYDASTDRIWLDMLVKPAFYDEIEDYVMFCFEEGSVRCKLSDLWITEPSNKKHNLPSCNYENSCWQVTNYNQAPN